MTATSPPATAEASGAPGRLRRWRAIVFAPVGDGTARRRGSDVVRLLGAALVVLVSWIIIQAGTHPEDVVEKVVHPPPDGLDWLVGLVWVLGSVGVIVVLVLLALLARRREVARDAALAGVGAWLISLALSALAGASGGRSDVAAYHGVNTGFPLARVTATVAVATAVLPYLSRSVQRVVKVVIPVAALSGVVYGQGLPVDVLASLALGVAVTAAIHLGFGTPLGLPSGSEVAQLLEELEVRARTMAPASHQPWGVGRFHGVLEDDRPLDVSYYGRDASDSQLLAKCWRFVMYRDSGPTLALTRLQQVEHEAYLTLLAERSGAGVPSVLVAGTSTVTRDVVLASCPPPGRRLADVRPEEVNDDDLRGVLNGVMSLRHARVAHGAINLQTIVVGPGVSGFVDFRCASSSAGDDRLNRDVAGVLAALAAVVGAERTVAAAGAVLPEGVLVASLAHLQPAALDPVAARSLRHERALLKELRERGAAAVGVETPKLTEPRRISWVSLVFALGTLIGGWALIGVLVDVAGSIDTIAGAAWGWVVVVFVLSQLAFPADALTVLGSVTGPLPFGRSLALEVSNSFTSLAAGTMGCLAARVRFFQTQGYPATLAVSSGVLVSTASWIVKGALFLVALPLSLSNFDVHQQGGSGDSHLVWLVVAVVVAVAVAAGVVLAVPRLRSLAKDKLRPRLHDVLDQLKELASQPRKLVLVLGGCLGAQLAVAFALGASLHAFGQHLSLATILVVLTVGSMLGGVSPVPGGMGVVEAGMILGLTAAGISESEAVAAVFVQRLFTAYLPPIWGWFVLMWMRRREYL